MGSVIVFIEGPAPTEEDVALYKSVKADQFLNVSLHGTGIVKHSWATAVNPNIIPNGYVTTEPSVAPEAAKTPIANPTVPSQAGTKPMVGIQPDNTPPVATGTTALPFPGLKAD